mmetsp:Transcript_133937/g.232480  ORF Transcript_133937/g.232480 Transcript_133937/m.232480 type:complete len:81 (-) Transcript_133937:1365-1607(-)
MGSNLVATMRVRTETLTFEDLQGSLWAEAGTGKRQAGEWQGEKGKQKKTCICEDTHLSQTTQPFAAGAVNVHVIVMFDCG